MAFILGGRFLSVLMIVRTAEPIPSPLAFPSSSFRGSRTLSVTAQQVTPQVNSTEKVEISESFLNCVSPKEGPKRATRSSEPML